MKLVTMILSAGLTLGTAAAFSGSAFAHGEGDEHNLKVLKDNGKALEKGMKSFAKGLGVKCNVCHVKGKFASDEKKEKEEARTFLGAVVSASDQAKKDAALQDLLKALKIKEAKDAKSIWEGVSRFEKK